MDIYQHFACYQKLPVRLSLIREFILETGIVTKLICFPVDMHDGALMGGLHLYRDLAPYAAHGAKVARIGYDRSLPDEWKRVVCAKEMLHVFATPDETAPTRELVDRLIDDLLMEQWWKDAGLPANCDHRGVFHALAVLFPLEALDYIRPRFKLGKLTIEQIAKEAKLPEPLVRIAMTDYWRDLAFTAA